MGLFCTVIHVHEFGGPAVGQARDAVLRAKGFLRKATSPVGLDGPKAGTDAALTYAYGPVRGDWSTIIEVDVAKSGSPWHADVAVELSKELGTYVLSLHVHDDDVLYYNLDYRGRSLDGYNSNPQYFEQKRIAESSVAEQRHTPEVFTPLLPHGVVLSSLIDLLDRGWWAAHDAGRLDEDGLPTDEDDGFVFEGERLTEIGNLLRLHGSDSGYPYSAWGEAPSSDWEGFVEAQFAQASHRVAADLLRSRLNAIS